MTGFHGKAGDRMSILNQLKEEHLFTSAEQEVVRYILQHPRTVISATIGEAAQGAFSSPSTVGRVCKKLGIGRFRGSGRHPASLYPDRGGDLHAVCAGDQLSETG